MSRRKNVGKSCNDSWRGLATLSDLEDLEALEGQAVSSKRNVRHDHS